MKKLLSTLVLLPVLLIESYAQQKRETATKEWKMQPIPLQSRWAKKVTPVNVWQEYPRPQMVRKNWQNLNGLWEYAVTPKGAAKPLLFQGKILVPFPIESALSGVQQPLTPDQHLWYRRTLQKPDLVANERLLLHFGAIDWQATVFINDKEVGQHSGGYQSFSLDITNYLKTGANELVVKVYDPTDQGLNPHGKQVLYPENVYHTGSSGIWQTVWVEKVPATYISWLRTTPYIDQGSLSVTVKTSGAASDLMVVLSAQTKGKVVNTVKGRAGAELRLPIKNARLWSPDDPFLYDLSVKLVQGNKTIDEVNSYFGMRKIEVKKDERGIDRIFLNNKYTYNLGVLDQGFWPEGLMTAPTDKALAFDIRAIKAMGFNSIRKQIKIEPARWYYHADKTGILVWQDFVNPPHILPKGSREIFEKETKETMDQLHNFPSIITWVLFTEGWGAYDQQRLTKWVRSHDPSRLVNGHSGELLFINEQLRSPADSPWLGSDMTDIHSYPDPMRPPVQRGKAQVLGEFGDLTVAVLGHQWDDLKGWGYEQVLPADLDGRYAIMIKRLKKLQVEGLSGSIFTQFFDVESEENGLLTYDRAVIKIPLKRLRQLHGLLVKQTKGFLLNPAFHLAKDINVQNTDESYAELLQEYEKGRADSAFLRRLVLMALRKQDQPMATKIGATYIDQLKQPYTKGNLNFILKTTRTSNDKGFEILCTEGERINAALGKNIAENKLNNVIRKEEIGPYMIDKKLQPDWAAIEKRVTGKYGEQRKEVVFGGAMAYYWERKDWKNFAKFYVLYYEKALCRSIYHINNMSWSIFENITDPTILSFAVKVARFNIDTFDKDDPYAIDTYANLLYKAGNPQEAIEWEGKAVKLSNNGRIFVETLEKMKKGQPTWPTGNSGSTD